MTKTEKRYLEWGLVDAIEISAKYYNAGKHFPSYVAYLTISNALMVVMGVLNFCEIRDKVLEKNGIDKVAFLAMVDEKKNNGE